MLQIVDFWSLFSNFLISSSFLNFRLNFPSNGCLRNQSNTDVLQFSLICNYIYINFSWILLLNNANCLVTGRYFLLLLNNANCLVTGRYFQKPTTILKVFLMSFFQMEFWNRFVGNIHTWYVQFTIQIMIQS